MQKSPVSKMNSWTKEKLFDLATAAPLILWFSLAAVGCLFRIIEILETGGDTFAVISQLANLSFFALVVSVLFLRRLPIRKADGIGPKFAGFVGCIAPLMVLALPRKVVSFPLGHLLSAVSFIGIVASIYAVFWLGRSFSILPQARGLVTDGPYRHVRHPLYLAEFLVIFSRAAELAPPWPIVVVTLVLVAQILRMQFEERLLCETYPAYREYMRRTARLVPGVY
ncbi:methyltransferase family protein [Methylocystis echinoides]|uniref:Protein-S-isoprenylcysteine methyltransferase n=1 Tax=Methylocystis echinoides TaxID=29468 RepID=A0A9W6GQL4_9HYPH|nr:isoprenylcysteine carboxylmethyltransferase family protein [Methylocystis echinoides]GLI91096.1 protein-S-isoprenylcysteine methyltransferase [Methylocystis echinoides]